MPHEYQIHIKLPGFTWDGITLATKRKKILHVVADRWDKTGGHFERRVAFGYDADLTQVKADFNGDMLRIGVPRRAASVALMQPSATRLAPIGRLS
jgi:HSP20 family molecular chaperone IbpA